MNHSSSWNDGPARGAGAPSREGDQQRRGRVPGAQESNGRLGDVLAQWAAGDDFRVAVADTICAIADAAVTLGRRLEISPWASGGAEETLTSGHAQKAIDAEAHSLFVQTLGRAPVAAVASEEDDHVVPLRRGAPLVVAIDPIDGSNNLPVNGPVGTIFSIRPSHGGGEADFLRPGREQVGAGFALYGPATLLVISVGVGTDVYVLRPGDATFVRTVQGARVPLSTPAYSVNSSNARHWAPEVRTYVADLEAGAEGLRGRDFEMRWYGALVIEAFRILKDGGIYLYPADKRPERRSGRLHLVYEAHPIAYLIEQAGGRATDCEERILDKAAPHVHARTPLVFGSADKVDRFGRYLKSLHADAERHPLFTARGLFRG